MFGIVLLVRLKLFLANDGNYRETRYTLHFELQTQFYRLDFEAPFCFRAILRVFFAILASHYFDHSINHP